MNNMTQELVPNFKYAAKILAAKAMAESVHYLSNRDFLTDIGKYKTYSLSINENQDFTCEILWIKVSQVGICNTNTIHEHFSSFQKILHSCHEPKCKQFVFVVNGDGKKISLYLGVRFFENDNDSDSFMHGMASFVQNLYPGAVSEVLTDIDKEVSLKENLRDWKLKTLNAVTGIPSFVKSGEERFNSIDTIVGTLSKTNFCYMVVADPISEGEIQAIITQCNEMSGQMESVKNYNYSESLNSNKSSSYTETESHYSNWSKSESTSKKNTAGQLLFGGLTLAAASMFLPSVHILPVVAKQLADSKNFGLGFMTGTGILSGFVPQNSSSSTKGGGDSYGSSTTEGYSEGQAQTLSLTIVNKHAERIANKLNQHIKRFEQGLGQGMWKVSSYILTENPTIANTVSLQLKSVISGEKSNLEPIRIHNISYLLNSKSNSEIATRCLTNYSHPRLSISYINTNNELAYLNNPFENSVAHLNTLLTTEELSCMINFPQKSVPGISVVESFPNLCMTPQSLDSKGPTINLGNILFNGNESNIPVSIPIDVLSRHCMVAGVNGSGKTNTVLKILNGFLQHERPFFILEPAKTEYVDWALKYNATVEDPSKKIRIFMPGCKNYGRAKHLPNCGKQYAEGFIPEILGINPFDTVSLPGCEKRILAHLDRLKDTLAAAFPMQDILPVLIEHLLYTLYDDKCNWINDQSDCIRKETPRLNLIDDELISNVMRELDYATDNNKNMSAALKNRINSLNYGWKKDLLDNENLCIKSQEDKDRIDYLSWMDLWEKPTIVNLSYAGDDRDKSFVMSLLLLFLYEFRISESEMPTFDYDSDECRHLLVVEEAHRVMTQCSNPDLPQYKSGQMISNFLSEVRAYGQGVMIVDQVPSRLIEDAIKNTNVKIVHKLVASDDSKRIAECIGLTENERKIIPRLSVGQTILSGLNSANILSSDSSDIYLAQIKKMK